jgi:hypothetical protein
LPCPDLGTIAPVSGWKHWSAKRETVAGEIYHWWSAITVGDDVRCKWGYFPIGSKKVPMTTVHYVNHAKRLGGWDSGKLAPWN